MFHYRFIILDLVFPIYLIVYFFLSSVVTVCCIPHKFPNLAFSGLYAAMLLASLL